MNERPPAGGFTEDPWVKAARILAAISALLWLIMAGVLLLAEPPRQCPGWHLKNQNESSLWALLIAWGGPANLFGCMIAIRWNWFIEKVSRKSKFDVPATYILTRMLVMNSVVAQWPLFMLLSKCTPLLGLGR